MKFDISWKNHLIAQLKMGRPLNLSARIMRIGQDRIIFEKKRDPEFAKAMEEAEATPVKRIQF